MSPLFHFIELDITIQALILAVCSAVLSFVFVRFGASTFQRFGILDRPYLYPHEQHRVPVPYGLGVILFLNFTFLSFLFLGFDVDKLRVIFLLGLIVTIVSFLDDLNTIGKFRRIPPAVRLTLQIGVGAIIGMTSIKIGYVSNLLGGIVHLDAYWFAIGGVHIYTIPLIFTILWYVLVFNSINWSDCVP